MKNSSQFKKIIFFIGGIYNGGQERQLLYLCKNITDEFTVEIIAWRSMGNDDITLQRFLRANVDIFWPKHSSSIYKLFEILLYVIKKKPDLIASYSFYMNFLSYLVASLLNIKNVGALRNTLLFERSRLSRFMFYLNIALNKNVISNNQKAISEKIYFPLIRKNQNIYYIKNGIELKNYSKSHNKIYDIVTIGRLAPEKNWDFFISVVSALTKKFPEIKVNIIGNGPLLDHVQKLIKQENLQSNIKITTPVEFVFDYLSEGKIFLLTSKFEGTSNAILEAMLVGLPIVCSDAGDNNIIIENWKNGFVLAQNTLPSYVERIHQLLLDDTLRLSIGLENINKISTEYNMNLFINSTKSIYRQILSAK
jgi:glycosyltransferase involved in cell wall biosynthesis